jgi:biopolymer transport protein ExbB
MLRSGLENASRGPKAMDTVMSASMASMRGQMDRGITFLGTLGNNAVYIGLFGTVIGIIRAFDALAKEGGAALAEGGASSVMAGISEALVATAVGLFVTIPAVIAFNYFNKQVRKNLLQADSVKKMVVAHYQ